MRGGGISEVARSELSRVGPPFPNRNSDGHRRPCRRKLGSGKAALCRTAVRHLAIGNAIVIAEPAAGSLCHVWRGR